MPCRDNRAADILVASLGLFLCLVSVRTYCVPIATLNQNKRSRLSSGEGKPDLVVDQDQQYKTTLKTDGKTDRTAKGYKFIYPIFRLDKTSLHQGLEKLSENRINGCSI